MNDEHSRLRPGVSRLNYTTPDGLFVAFGGATYWVFQSHRGRFAIQLSATPTRPAFSFQRLSDDPIAVGVWLGPVQLRLGAELNDSGRGRCGLIIRKGFRLYIKVNHPSGTSEPLLVLPYDLDECSRWCAFYADWSLMAAGTTAPDACFFRSPDRPPRLRPYPDEDECEDDEEEEEEEDEGAPPQLRPVLKVVSDQRPFRDGDDQQ